MLGSRLLRFLPNCPLSRQMHEALPVTSRSEAYLQASP
jgi:hypothetical protein